MIVLPPGLVSTKYKGYFYDIQNKKMYSIKTGILKELKQSKSYRTPYGYLHPETWHVSVNGVKTAVNKNYLSKLTYPKEVEVFPIENR